MTSPRLCVIVSLLIVSSVALAREASAEGAPLDLWPAERLARIRDKSTLNLQLIPRIGYWDVSFDSEIGDAKWADSEPPYAVHTGDTIRIHGYLGIPPAGGPYPALVMAMGIMVKGARRLRLPRRRPGWWRFRLTDHDRDCPPEVRKTPSKPGSRSSKA